MKHKTLLLVLLGLGTCALLMFVLVIARYLTSKEPNVVQLRSINIQEYMQHPSKCYSCEAPLAEMGAWKSQKSKCFTCDAELGV